MHNTWSQLKSSDVKVTAEDGSCSVGHLDLGGSRTDCSHMRSVHEKLSPSLVTGLRIFTCTKYSCFWKVNVAQKQNIKTRRVILGCMAVPN